MDVYFSLKDIDSIASGFLKEIGNKKVIAFHGEMAAGKTTFINALCKAKGVKDAVSSPTFSIINEYTTAEGFSLYHLDLYRLKNEKEAVDAGVEDCYYSGSLCLVEWPEIAPSLLPEDAVHCFITVTDADGRRLTVKS